MMSSSCQYFAGGFHGPRVSIGNDVRGFAGFLPALMVDISVPQDHAPVELLGPWTIGSAEALAHEIPERIDAWVLGTGPRKAIAVEQTAVFKSCSSAAPTLYKLFFRLIGAGPWLFTAPPMRCGDWHLDLPGHKLTLWPDQQLIHVGVVQ